MLMQDTYWCNDNRWVKSSLKIICTSHFIVRFEKGYSGFYCERELETEHNCNVLTPHSYGRQRCIFLVLQSCSTRGPGAQFSAECWLSLPHLVSNFSGPQLIRGSKGPLHRAFSTTYQQLLWTPTQSGAPRAPSAWCGFPYHISSATPDFLSWLDYILVQRPLNHPLNLWNGMFDRHQVEITVMQFTGHSLPVHQSMSVPWDFLPCPISSAKSRLRDFFWLLAIGMCHFLPVHHFGMAYLPGSKVKIQQYRLWTGLFEFIFCENHYATCLCVCVSVCIYIYIYMVLLFPSL